MRRVMGCVARVWVVYRVNTAASRMRFVAESDLKLSHGYCPCLVAAMDGAQPEEVDLGPWS
jgi:sulfur transfer protein SufE